MSSLSNLDISSNIYDCDFERNKATIQSTLDLILTQARIESVRFIDNYSAFKTEGISAVKSKITLIDGHFQNK